MLFRSHIAIGYFSGTVIETNEAGEPTTDGGYFQLGTMLGVANEDASTSGMLWSNPTNATNQTNPWTGKANTVALYKLINGETTTYPAAKVAIETNKNFSTISSVNDANYIWYLPAQKQLMAAWIVNEALTDDGTFKPFGCDLYWSATEGDTGNAWSVSFNRGNTNTYFKPSIIRVRFVRDLK